MARPTTDRMKSNLPPHVPRSGRSSTLFVTLEPDPPAPALLPHWFISRESKCFSLVSGHSRVSVILWLAGSSQRHSGHLKINQKHLCISQISSSPTLINKITMHLLIFSLYLIFSAFRQKRQLDWSYSEKQLAYLLHDAIEGKMTEVNRVGRRRIQFLDDLRNRIRY